MSEKSDDDDDDNNMMVMVVLMIYATYPQRCSFYLNVNSLETKILI